MCKLSQTINQKLKALQDKLLSEAIKLDKALHVRVQDKNDVLSAYGDVQSEAVKKEKQAWVEKYLGKNTELLLVRKVHEKPSMMKERVNKHILIDDRVDAINAWESAGGIGILFQ